MKAKRILVFIVIAAALAPASFAQTVSQPVPAQVGVDSAQQLLKEISIAKFEDASFWVSGMPLDQGLVTLRRLEGAPQGRQPIADEAKVGITEADKYVLGVKVNFYKRGLSYFTVSPANPLPIEGIVKTISVWAVGRNFNHVLKVLIQDYSGRKLELTMGKLNFLGWKQLVVAVPPGIVQSELHLSNQSGIKVIGFRVDCDPIEDYGTYYLYLDDLRAVTDLFGESKRDTDDMMDGW
jgi:hypothetical protein